MKRQMESHLEDAMESWKNSSFLDGRVGEGDKSWEDSFVAY